jgi:hypothetical protein
MGRVIRLRNRLFGDDIINDRGFSAREEALRGENRMGTGLGTFDTGSASRRASDLVPGAGATRRQWPDNRPAYGGPERRQSGQRGEATSDGYRYNYETQRWEPDDRR